MIQSDIEIVLSIYADTRDKRKVQIRLDQEILHHAPLQSVSVPFVIKKRLPVGKHQLTVDIEQSLPGTQPTGAEIIVESLRFQHLNDEFKIFSCYRPIYPDHWIIENIARNHALEPVIHSNHLGWPGRWWIDFETPVYRWLHKKLNLGWLI